LPTYRFYADSYPDYLPFVYKTAMANLNDSREPVQHRIPENLHLKNFYPGKTTFCRYEVLLYTQLLTLQYRLTGEITMAEIMMRYLGLQHPGVIPDNDFLVSKFAKLPKVFDWCETWLKNQE
jgi:hypothetical protein